MMAASQRQQELKFEIMVQIAGPEPTAVASFNYHQDHFGETFGLELADGGGRPHVAASASAWSGSRWRCSRRTASTRRVAGEVARGAWRWR